jgi:hypothetical protein
MATAAAELVAGPAIGGIEAARRLDEVVHAVILEAMAFVPPARPIALAQQWLGRAGPMNDDEATFRAALATALALDLALFQPSLSGQTAFDRLARSRGKLLPDAAAAVETLRRSRFRLLHAEALERDGLVRLRDRATGEALLVLDDGFPKQALGCDLVGQIGPAPAGLWLSTGAITPLDAAALRVAESFVAPNGRGLVSPLRCAEAVYRHVARHGTLLIAGLNLPPEAAPDDAFPLRADASDHDALAFAWAERDADAAPPRDEIERARAAARLHPILDVIDGALTARAWERERLANGYTRVLSVQLETLLHREAAAMGALRLADVREAIALAQAHGKFPPAAGALFEMVLRKLGKPSAGREHKDDAELERLIQRIRALRAKTVEQGCTEQEALAAAEKVAELLDRYGLSLSELDLRRQACEGVGIETDRRRAAPIDDCTPTIAAFFDCRTWIERREDAPIRHVFFGLPADVAAARYLYDLVERAFETETAGFKAGKIYAATPSGGRRRATASFQHGMTLGICRKLAALRQARETALHSGSGRDLIPIKTSIVEEEMAKLGLNFRAKGGSRGRMVQRDAYAAGQEAGDRFDYAPGIAQAP